MKLAYILIAGLVCNHISGQVGVNTPKPLSTFEIHKSSLSTVAEGVILPRITGDSLTLKDHLYGPAQNGTFIQITTPVKSAISVRTANISSPGYYMFDANHTNGDKSKGIWKKMFSDPAAFAAKGKSGVKLSNSSLRLMDSPFQTIRFDGKMNRELGAELSTTDQYLVPETGLYSISYSIKFKKRLNSIKDVSQPPAAAISRTSEGNISTVLDYSEFAIFDVSDKEHILIPKASINHIYSLAGGEKLTFGLLSRNYDLNTLGEISAEISIFKIR